MVHLSQDRKIGIALIVLAVVLFVETLGFPIRKHLILNVSFWPRVILSLLAILGCGLIVTNRSEGEGARLKLNAFLTVGAGLVYTVLLEPVGFLILTPVFIFISNIVLGKTYTTKRFASAAAISIIGTGCIFFIFQKVMLIQLPEGFLR